MTECVDSHQLCRSISFWLFGHSFVYLSQSVTHSHRSIDARAPTMQVSQWSNEEDGVARELEALLLQSAGSAWGITDGATVGQSTAAAGDDCGSGGGGGSGHM